MSDIVSEIQRWEQDRNTRLQLEDRLALQLAHTPCGDVFRFINNHQVYSLFNLYYANL